jgi:predicted amidohydrolase
MPYPTDPAALFMELYDQLSDDVFLADDPVKWDNEDAWVTLHAMRVYEHILTHGEADPSQVERIVKEGDDRGIFTVLRGIDWALALINPFDDTFEHGNLEWLAKRYAETGQLNNGPEAEGALLPRGTYPGRPRGTSRKALYFRVHRVSRQSWAKINPKTLPNVCQPPKFRAGQYIPVGCAPLLETFDDVRLEVQERYKTLFFRIGPAGSQSLRKRISRVIRKLDDSDAAIGIIPESTLTDDLLNHWKEEAVRTATLDKPLRWLLVGTGPLGKNNPPVNRAVLLDRWTGREILSQDKLTSFILTADQVRDWKLPGEPITEPAAEDITRGSAVTVLETALGRLAVVICEDLNQSIEWDRELFECGFTHLFVPIFSKPIMHFRWEQQGVERQITNSGAWLVVANSLVIQNALGPQPEEDKKQEDKKWYTCLIAGPKDPYRLGYGYDMQFGLAEAGHELGLVEREEELSLPLLGTAMTQAWWPGNPPDPDAA